eukprot:1142994-Pyramimonas_sp.AAC.1
MVTAGPYGCAAHCSVLWGGENSAVWKCAEHFSFGWRRGWVAWMRAVRLVQHGDGWVGWMCSEHMLFCKAVDAGSCPAMSPPSDSEAVQ